MQVNELYNLTNWINKEIKKQTIITTVSDSNLNITTKYLQSK